MEKENDEVKIPREYPGSRRNKLKLKKYLMLHYANTINNQMCGGSNQKWN